MPGRLKRCLEESPVVTMGNYDYIVCPVTDGIPSMDPKVLEEIIERIMDVSDLDCDLIVAPEAMGIPLAVSLSLRTGIPYNIVRKRQYGLPGEVSVCQITGYSKCQMYINGLKAGDRVVIVDDIVSTGGTLTALVRALRSMGVEVVEVIAVIEKGAGKERLEKEMALRIITLIKADVVNGRVVASDPACSEDHS
jgi:adenine phosphoribosyltransferase